MKKTITLLTLCLIGTISFAQQAPAIQWQKCLGGTSYDQAYSVQPTPDGGYIMAGYASSTDGDVIGNHGTSDARIVKLTAAGAIEWQKCLGGTGDEHAYSIQTTPDGGYIMAAYTTSTNGDVTGNHGGKDVWVVKLTATGVIVWQKCLGGTGDDNASSIQVTPDGGYIVAGSTKSTNGDVTGNHGGTDAWIVKISATGGLLWQITLGGTGTDEANSIQPASDGGYIVAGSTNSTNGDVTGNHGLYDAWVVKLGTSGALVWQKCLGGTDLDFAQSIQPTADGGYIIEVYASSINGDVTGNHGAEDAWVVKLSATGGLVWQKCLGGTGSDYVNSIQPTSDGGYILSIESNSTNGDITGNHGLYDAWIAKISATGVLVWQKALGGTGNDAAYDIQPSANGGYIVVGTTWSNDGDASGNHGNDDAWVVKLGPELATSTFNNQVLTLYPNPTNGLLQLQTPNNISFNKIIITDSTGKTVLEQTQNTTQVNVEKLASGLYIIKAFSGEEVFVNKFVKN